MKTFGFLIKATALSGIMFLLPLVLLVMFVGKAFNIVKTVSSPLANFVSASSFAGYAVVDLLADGWVAVFSPDVRNTRSGSVATFTDDRIVPLDTDLAGIASCLKTLGRGSSKIISNTPLLRRNV